MQPERRIPRFLTGVALATALLILVAVALVQAFGWYRFVPVLSGSMSPYIETGDLAVLQPLDATDLAVGDVIAFEAPIGDHQLMLHRVSEVVSPAPELRIRTQGDANASDDPWTASVDDEILWRATGQVPALGQPVVFAHRVGAPIIVSLVAGVILLGLIMRRLWMIDDETDGADSRLGDGPVPDEGPPVESVLAMVVVAAVAMAGIGLILARPARATFTASAGEEQRVTFRPTDVAEALPPPTELVAQVVCDVLGAPTAVDLTWTAPVTTGDYISIERSSTPLLGTPEPFAELGQVGGTDETFADDFASVDPPPNNPLAVEYRVRSGTAAGEFSDYSNVAPVDLCIPLLGS